MADAKPFTDKQMQWLQDWVDEKLPSYPLGHDANEEALILVKGFLDTIAADHKRIGELKSEVDFHDRVAERNYFKYIALNEIWQKVTGRKGVLSDHSALLDWLKEHIADQAATVERLRGALKDADELLQRHDAGQLHNDHYKGHVLQKDTVAFFARQVIDRKEE